MADVLSQAEIEALLSSLSEPTAESPADAPAPAVGVPDHAAPPTAPAGLPHEFGGGQDRQPIAYEIYDFRRPDKFSKDQLRTLQMLHETFARLFASSLSAYLRTAVHIDLISVEQIPYDEYIRSLSNSIITIFSLPPLTGQAVLEMDTDIIFAMIDRLLGGPGLAVKRTNVLTEIERTLTESLVDRAFNEFRAGWEGIAPIDPKREAIETSAQFVQIAPPNDIIVSILCEVKVGERRGAMSLCIPYLVMKPITAKLSAQRWFSSGRRSNSQNAAVLARRLETTRIPCAVSLGRGQITVGDLLNLEVGDQISLSRRFGDEVDLLVGQQVKFRGYACRSGKKLAIKVTRPVRDEDGPEKNL